MLQLCGEIPWSKHDLIYIFSHYLSPPTDSTSPSRPQAIIWTNAGILLIGPLGTNFSEIFIKITTFSFKKMRSKVSSGKRRPSCLGLNVINASIFNDMSWSVPTIILTFCPYLYSLHSMIPCTFILNRFLYRLSWLQKCHLLTHKWFVYIFRIYISSLS